MARKIGEEELADYNAGIQAEPPKGERQIGNNFDNEIQGGAGSDTLVGGHGNDRLMGGAGNDVLVGGTGDNTLIGGMGADTFVVKMGEEGKQGIEDFSLRDKLVVQGLNPEIVVLFQDGDVSKEDIAALKTSLGDKIQFGGNVSMEDVNVQVGKNGQLEISIAQR